MLQKLKYNLNCISF